MRAAPSCVLLLLTGCTLSVGGIPRELGRDGAVPDAGGRADGGRVDGGLLDAGALDAAPTDAGADSGGVDGGRLDAGAPPRDIFVEAEDHDRTSSSDGVHAFVTETTLGGFSGTGYIISLPDSGDSCSSPSVATCGAVAEYDFFVPEDASYRPFFLFQADSMDDDSYHWQLDDLGVHTENTAVETTWTWDRGGMQHSLSSGPHTLYFYMRENAFKLDAVFITTTGSPPE